MPIMPYKLFYVKLNTIYSRPGIDSKKNGGFLAEDAVMPFVCPVRSYPVMTDLEVDRHDGRGERPVGFPLGFRNGAPVDPLRMLVASADMDAGTRARRAAAAGADGRENDQ